jgi:hypothetical protein
MTSNEESAKIRSLQLQLDIAHDTIKVQDRTIMDQKMCILVLVETIRKLTEVPLTNYTVVEKKEDKNPHQQ